jgi:hypothetical protein
MNAFSRPVSGAQRQGRGHGFLIYAFVDAAHGGHVYAKQVCWMVRDIPCDTHIHIIEDEYLRRKGEKEEHYADELFV